MCASDGPEPYVLSYRVREYESTRCNAHKHSHVYTLLSSLRRIPHCCIVVCFSWPLDTKDKPIPTIKIIIFHAWSLRSFDNILCSCALRAASLRQMRDSQCEWKLQVPAYSNHISVSFFSPSFSFYRFPNITFRISDFSFGISINHTATVIIIILYLAWTVSLFHSRDILVRCKYMGAGMFSL